MCGKPTAFRQAAQPEYFIFEPGVRKGSSLSAHQAAKPRFFHSLCLWARLFCPRRVGSLILFASFPRGKASLLRELETPPATSGRDARATKLFPRPWGLFGHQLAHNNQLCAPVVSPDRVLEYTEKQSIFFNRKNRVRVGMEIAPTIMLGGGSGFSGRVQDKGGAPCSED
jgi:hypothetical protein